MKNNYKNKSKYKSKYNLNKEINNQNPNPTYLGDNYEDFMLLGEETQDRLAERQGFTDSEEYSDYLWAMDKED